MKHEVVKQIAFCYGHRLMDYEGKCRHPHGHNGLAEIAVSAEGLDARGMVVDFGEIKAGVKGWIDEHLDHQMLLRRDDPLVELLGNLGEPLHVMEDNPTAENIAREIFLAARAAGLAVTRVTLWETPDSNATYRG
ncbi:MAG: 6-carboxytetrahydropterin synthase [Candidatus Sericytochromatia bacterium]|nr:6-carboxytetrahydropterin synthase [Candidatus Tanganyikabacteria bacterium]